MDNAAIHAPVMGNAADRYADAKLIWWNRNHGKNNGKRALLCFFRFGQKGGQLWRLADLIKIIFLSKTKKL